MVEFPSKGEVANTLKSISQEWEQKLDTNGFWGFFHKGFELAYLSGSAGAEVFNFVNSPAGLTFTNVNPGVDNTNVVGTAALRWASINAVLFNVWKASGDANASAQMSDHTLKFGPGGSTALDTTIARTAAGEISLPNLQNSTGWFLDGANTSEGVLFQEGQTWVVASAYEFVARNPGGGVSAKPVVFAFQATGGGAITEIFRMTTSSTLQLSVNMVMGSDNAVILGDATNRIRNINMGNVLNMFLASQDTQANLQLAAGSSPAINFGPGGSTAPPNSITYDHATGDMQFLIPTSTHFDFKVNAVQQISISGNGLQIGNLPAFAAGDKYLICDASGNVHKSGLGPAS